jgi:hypothetical protein
VHASSTAHQRKTGPRSPWDPFKAFYSLLPVVQFAVCAEDTPENPKNVHVKLRKISNQIKLRFHSPQNLGAKSPVPAPVGLWRFMSAQASLTTLGSFRSDWERIGDGVVESPFAYLLAITVFFFVVNRTVRAQSHHRVFTLPP